MPTGQVNMLLKIPGAAPPPEDGIVGQVNLLLTIPETPPEDGDGAPPGDFETWLRENLELLAAAGIAAYLLLAPEEKKEK